MRYIFAGDRERDEFFLPDSLSLMRHVTSISDHAVLNFEFCGRGTHINELVGQVHEFVEIERPIIECAGKTKSVVDQHCFAGPITFIHSADLRDGGVRFIDDHEKIFREEIDDRVRL